MNLKDHKRRILSTQGDILADKTSYKNLVIILLRL